MDEVIPLPNINRSEGFILKSPDEGMKNQQEQFLKLVEANKGIIFKIIRLYIDDEDDAEDMHQEILLQAWRSFGRFKGDAKFSTWLYRVSLNTVLTFRRRPQLVKREERLDQIAGGEDPYPKKESSEALLWAIRQLNEIDRMIISLHLEGYGNEDVAEITGLTKNNVGVKLHRIKDVLTKKLNAA